MNRTRTTLTAAALLAALSLPALAQPVSLDGLSEKEALRRVRAARPTATFTLRGRTVTAADLQRDLANLAARQRQRDARALAAATAVAPDPQRTAAALNERLAQQTADANRQRERLVRRLTECGKPADSPELQRLAGQAADLLRAWDRATPEEKVALSRRAQELARSLEGLPGGAPRP